MPGRKIRRVRMVKFYRDPSADELEAAAAVLTELAKAVRSNV